MGLKGSLILPVLSFFKVSVLSRHFRVSLLFRRRIQLKSVEDILKCV